MNLIAEGNEVLEILTDKNSLISGTLEKIAIYYQETGLVIDLNIKLMYSRKM